MLRVFICDDVLLFRVQIIELLNNYSELSKNPVEIKSFPSASKLLEEDVNECDLFFLDIKIGEGMSGIELAKQIRTTNGRADIIFTTSHEEFVFNAFEVNALRYLLKPIEKEKFIEAMDCVIRNIEDKSSKTMVCHQGQRLLQIPICEIIYFETVDRKLRVVTYQKEYMVDNKINDVDKKMQEKGFFRIHKSYVINMKYIKEYNQSTVIMQNEDCVYISRLRVKAFKEAFRNYLKEAHRLG